MAGLAATVSLATAASLAAPASATKPGSGTTTGTAQVFMVNPVQSSGDESLTDQKDSADRRPGSSRTPPSQLRNLDGSGTSSASG